LLRTLRTEPNVRLAVLYGSAARGDDHAGSDVDLLVAFRNDTPAAAGTLVVRLERALGREVDVARLAPVSANAPLLLLDALDEGRVLIDRDDLWHELTQRRAAIAKAAKQSLKTIEAAATASLAELLAEAEQGDRELAED
jgi:predicted nucleotidyltransferase